MKKKWPWLTALCTAVVSLAVGASFHGFRMHPENAQTYKIGVTMGITMAGIFAVAIVMFVILFCCYKRKR